jgi:hypothetical protein
MLSKAVKLRQRVNRELRKRPHWRTCMLGLRQQQLTLLKLEFNSVRGAHANTQAVAQPTVSKYFGDALKLKQQMKHMTREEFLEDLVKNHNTTRTFDMKFWARVLVEGNIDRDIESKKLQRKLRRK